MEIVRKSIDSLDERFSNRCPNGIVILMTDVDDSYCFFLITSIGIDYLSIRHLGDSGGLKRFYKNFLENYKDADIPNIENIQKLYINDEWSSFVIER